MDNIEYEYEFKSSFIVLQVSLACPLGKMRMNIPCRSSTCDHLQTFDAALYLQMNEKKPKVRGRLFSWPPSNRVDAFNLSDDFVTVSIDLQIQIQNHCFLLNFDPFKLNFVCIFSGSARYAISLRCSRIYSSTDSSVSQSSQSQTFIHSNIH